MLKFYKLLGREHPSGIVGQTICARTVQFANYGGSGPMHFVLIVDNNVVDRYFNSAAVSEVDRSECINCGPPSPLTPNQPYDCINGACLPKITYSTPGKYANLAACNSGCAKDSNCTGECIPTADLAALQTATTNLISRYCK